MSPLSANSFLGPQKAYIMCSRVSTHCHHLRVVNLVQFRLPHTTEGFYPSNTQNLQGFVPPNLFPAHTKSTERQTTPAQCPPTLPAPRSAWLPHPEFHKILLKPAPSAAPFNAFSPVCNLRKPTFRYYLHVYNDKAQFVRHSKSRLSRPFLARPQL